MLGAELNSESIRKIRSAFERLGIKPTIDRNAVIKAFRRAAREVHPDRFQQQQDKLKAHHEFITLIQARDTVLVAIAHPTIIEYLSGAREMPPETQWMPSDDGARRTAYEQEWSVFVADEYAYFNIMTSTSATLWAVALAFGLSGMVSMLLGGWVILVLIVASIVGLMLCGLFSASVSIPIIGWIHLFWVIALCCQAFSAVSRRLNAAIDESARRLLTQVARTGYPIASFWIAILLAAGFLIPCAIVFNYANEPFLSGLMTAILVVMTGAMLAVYARISGELDRLNAAFEDIRKSSSYVLLGPVRK